MKKKKRIFFISKWAEKMSEVVKPQLEFSGKNYKDYIGWRKKFEKKFRELLGPFPQGVPLNPVIVLHREFPDYMAEKVIYDTERFMSVPAWVCYPRNKKKGEKLPVVICCHGHGDKSSMAGLDRKGKPVDEDYGKKIGIRLAREGFLTISPDWRCFGERREPPERDPAPRDLCNMGNLLTQTFGYNLLTLDIWDGLRTIEYLASRSDTDMSRLGCVGCSFGGTMTMFLTAATEKIKASCISGYLSATAKSFIWGTCGSQILPELLQWGDRAEIAGLICPRPLLIQIGKYDSTFPSFYALQEFSRLKKIYDAAGVKDMLALDLFEGTHEINYPPILEWFNKWLK
ncbi:MAG TPA: alpha/beta hydrolase family protein [bacterium]|nr:alpha/beta hydrolase family protein [bacterium]HPP30527.1 alpha/beta hydrolase family protein [bacterium]